ncbi:NAD(P)H-quinone oxidoreductase [Hyphobacterium marinum]|uniref:NAD(P)H-quinone oxidoreductase n=1 Tax=Hyphobacterium marinum TaxID=3116574 RepID=A0ABU7LYL9_9PROT|nr:NAD(P)H-quinone oxidoreductase [Hyphobacterium sp. Y6023]MEE2566551.1 NAD(P)H-quinone oxidoreductase [Hyphobacterium sp. Y6023]
MSQTMRAITAPSPGGPDALTLEKRPLPEPAPGEVRIAVTAAGVNRPDVFQRLGFYPPPKDASDILGLEVSGTIDALGEGVTGWKTGDEVCALVAGGGYAEAVTVNAGSVLARPGTLSLRDCAGLPETVFTVWANVFESGALRPGETLLVHGGTSGIGTMAIQMARAYGARVIATAGSNEKCVLCERLGAELAINYRETDFVEAVKAAGGAGVVLDMVGGDYTARNIAVLNPGGRLVNIAFLKGSKVEIDLMPVMLKRLTLTGSTLRARPVAEKARLAAAIRQTVWPWIAAGKLEPVIDSVFPLERAADAHSRIEDGDHMGKILLTV